MNGKTDSFIFIITMCCLIAALGLPVSPAQAITGTKTEITARVMLVTYNISVGSIDQNNATVTWMTNDDANSSVQYGKTTSYGSISTDGVMGRNHTVILHALSPGTIYHYRAVSVNLAGMSGASADLNFTTEAIPAGTVTTTVNTSTSFTGTTVQTVSGVQQVSLNLTDTQGTVQVSGNTVIVDNPGNGWSKIKYVGSSVATENGSVTIGQIQEVKLESDPVTATLGGTIGTVSAQIEVGLRELATGAAIQQDIIQGASTTVTNAFQLAATDSNLDLQAVAYTVQFHNTAELNSLRSSSGVKLNLSVDHAWVVANAPNGDRNNVKILRFGDDGTKQVLSTRYLGSLGTTDYFEADSPQGLSIFGIVTVASASSEGDGGNGGGGDGGSIDSGGSVSGGGSGITGNIVGQQGQMGGEVQGGEILEQAGPARGGATITQSLSVAGLEVATGPDGSQVFSIDTRSAEQSGVAISVKDNIVTLVQPGFTLMVITKEDVIQREGTLSGTVESVSLRTTPSLVDISIGTVSVSVDTSLASVPENAAITTTITEVVPSDVLSAFRIAAQSWNRQIEGIAYITVIEKTNFVSSGPATITMTIPPEWVLHHGGIERLSVIRLGDDRKAEVLNIINRGLDSDENIIVECQSPHGLSTFGLITIEEASVSQKTEPPVSSPGQGPDSLIVLAGDLVSGIIGFVRSYGIVLITFACVIAAGIILWLGWYERRSGK